MSESAPEPRTAPSAAPRPKAGQGKKYAGLTGAQWGIGGVVVLGIVGVVLIVRKRKAAASSAATMTATANTAQATGSCADGSTVPCGGLCPDGTAPSGCSSISNSTLQTELGDLESQLAQGGGSAGGGGGYTSGGTPAAASANTVTGTVGAVATTAKTTTPTAPAAGAKAGAISNLQASRVGATTATVSWNKASNASQGYAWRLTNLKTGAVIKSGNTMSTSVPLTGLPSKTSFNFGVQGLPGGPGDNIHFTTT